MKIGFRTLKTAVGFSLAVLIAEWLQLSYFTSSGILTMLCIQKTRKQSLAAVYERLLTCLLGLLLAGLLFTWVGYHAVYFLLLFVGFIPLCVKLRIQGGIISSAVIITHVYVERDFSLAFIWNEALVILIGLGVALAVNMYMPGTEKQMHRFKQDIQRHMAAILKELAKYLKEGYGYWDGREVLELSDLLQQAHNLAITEVENNWRKKDNPFFFYFQKKQQQFHLLEQIVPIVSKIDTQLEQGYRLGMFMEELAYGLMHDGDPRAFSYELKQIRDYHREMPLPASRAEFENRANMFSLANKLEDFIRKI